MAVIPLGSCVRSRTAEAKDAIRARYHLSREALVVGCFGFLEPNKLLVEAFQAFETLARANPGALLLFVGEDSDNGQCRETIQASRATDRVRFLGRRSGPEFDDLQAITDLGVNLRRPPTHGETSATLLGLLSFGVPTIVTDVATFSDYPDGVVRKVRWETEEIEGLRRAMLELGTNPALRQAMSRSARSYVSEHHDWPKVAAQYAEIIDRSHADGPASPAVHHPASASAAVH